MVVCTFDNPATWCRECWQDGKLLCSYSYLILPGIAREPIPGRLYFFGANVGEWSPGRLWGDPRATEPAYSHTDNKEPTPE
jgi:hypothetical protein